jgi:heme/copper-type cytochrome/quinol oxidase subunit 2
MSSRPSAVAVLVVAVIVIVAASSDSSSSSLTNRGVHSLVTHIPAVVVVALAGAAVAVAAAVAATDSRCMYTLLRSSVPVNIYEVGYRTR